MRLHLPKKLLAALATAFLTTAAATLATGSAAYGVEDITSDTNKASSGTYSGFNVSNNATLKINNGNGGAGQRNEGNTVTLGPTTIEAGSKLSLWSWTATKITYSTADKVTIAGDITLDGSSSTAATLYMQDGSYNFSGDITVVNKGVIEANYAKGNIIQSLKGDSSADLTFQRNNNDTGAGLFYLAGANEYAGTVTLLNKTATADKPNAWNNLVIGHADALKNAAVDLGATATAAGNVRNALELNVTSASVRALSGAGTVRLRSVTAEESGAAALTSATLSITGEDNGVFSGTVAENITLTIAENAKQTFSNASIGSTVINNGTLTISGSYTGGTITQGDGASLILSTGAIVNLDSITDTSPTLNDSDATGVKTWSGSWTLATGGTVTAENGVIYQYKGKSATGGSVSDGVISANGNYFNIISGDEKTYTEATDDDSINFINVLGKLTGLSDTITTAISGSGTLSMSAGTGEVTIAADKLTGFTGDLVVNSGRFNEASNGHLFSNVTVKNGGQFFINDGYNYTGSVSIAGTGWSKTGDLAWNGALRLGNNSTLSGKLTLTGDACIMAYYGANVTLAGEVDAGSYELTANGSGTLNIIKNASIGSLHAKASSITIGDGTNASVTTATRIEHGDAEVTSTTLTVSANSVLKITGNTNVGTNEVGDYKLLSAVLGEWRARTTANISGTVLAENAKLLAGDTGFTLNIKSNGLVATKGIDRAVTINNPTITVNLEGGSLILGDSGIAANGTNHSATSTGGVIGSYANTTTVATSLSLTSGTTTFDTSKYTINGTTNTVTVPTTDATGSDITIAGIISGDGALKATGAGKLILSTANTYTGGTTLDNGTIQASNNNALGTGKLTVNGNSGVIVDAANTLSVSSVDVINDSALSVSGKMSLTEVDALNIRTNAGVTIKESANLNLGNNKIWGAWENADAASIISIEKNGSLQHRDFSYSGKEGGGSVTVNKSFGTEGYGCFSIATEDAAASNVTLEYSGTSAATVKAALTGVSITTAANAGKLTVSSETKTISALTAGSSVDITNAADLSIADVTIAAGQTVGVFSGATASATPATDNEGTLTVTNLTANTGSTLNANLVLGSGTLTLNDTLAMGSTLTLSSGVTLSGDLLTGWTDRTQALTLFSGVDALTLGTGPASGEAITKEDGVDASTYFTNLGKGEFLLTYTGATGGGTVSLMNVPEPTTATLSLLALMGLAARRRRRKA